MDVTFVTESGAGLSDSTSYVSIVEFKQYWYNLGYSYSSLTEDDIKRLLNSSTNYINSNYSFPGTRQTSTQALEWPRSSAYYLDNYEIPEDTVPDEVKNATSEMAYQMHIGNAPSDIISKSGKILKESNQVDVIKTSVTYQEGTVLSVDIYSSVDALLYRLTGGVSSSYTLSIIRTAGESP